jgi:hypothetical protein
MSCSTLFCFELLCLVFIVLQIKHILIDTIFLLCYHQFVEIEKNVYISLAALISE